MIIKISEINTSFYKDWITIENNSLNINKEYEYILIELKKFINLDNSKIINDTIIYYDVRCIKEGCYFLE